MHEHHIRDYLIENIKLLSPELTFLEKEFKIKPTDGSRGYIDILATALGKYVIVEIKRSDQSARSTTNEIAKYVEGLKRNLSLNNDDIRVVVVSTHWKELTVPYAYMAKRLGIPCDGYLIEWNNDEVVKSTKIEVPKLVGMRLFSPVHSILWT
ncbi:MAG: endonuclease NucS domain-containing protein, partial [Cyanobacteria bacterium J06623_1]